MKVCLAIPSGGTVKTRLLTDVIVSLLSAKGSINWAIAELEGTLGPHNRWLAAMTAVQKKCDYLWLIDNDMVIPHDALPKLLAAKKDIIGAAYNLRQHPLQTIVTMLDAKGEIVFADPATFPDKPFVVHSVGSGCKLIRVDALKRIPQPWFALEWNQETGALSKTDDRWFCEQAAKVQIETWCHPHVKCSHIGDFFY